MPLAETKTIHRHFAAASAGKVEIEGYASLPDSRVGLAGRDSDSRGRCSGVSVHHKSCRTGQIAGKAECQATAGWVTLKARS